MHSASPPSMLAMTKAKSPSVDGRIQKAAVSRLMNHETDHRMAIEIG
jgi:hypothetical protein